MDILGMIKGGALSRSTVAAADAARDRGDWKAAARAYREVLEGDGSRADLWVQLGHALKESGDLDGAESAYRSALERNALVADTHLQLGHVLKLAGRLDQAAVAYVAAARLDATARDPVLELQTLAQQDVTLDEEARQIIGDSLKARRRARRPAPKDRTALRQWLNQASARGDLDSATAEGLRQGLAALEKLDKSEKALGRGGSRTAVVFDVSDLVGYFRNARLPTGIQRVQIEVISALLDAGDTDADVRVCAFTEGRSDWVEISPELFLDLAELSLVSGAVDDPAWLSIVRELGVEIELGSVLAFPRGAWLINLGTSWWLRNYFLKVRQARRKSGVRYVPFVHDMIPIMAPEHCVRPLTQDFISWALGVFAHADGYLTNSEASRRDLVAVGKRLGHEIDPKRIQVIRLDADFRKAVTAPMADTLAKYALKRQGYLLFVSTVESRKNHLLMFKALSELLRRHGPDAVPKLVCVGNRGWLNDAVFARLESDEALRRHVVMLSGVSDGDLSNLYDACLFSVYPSSYEGWGLPVTEALCHGKAVLASDSSSLPEAGGVFAEYFRDGDLADLTRKLERLIVEPERRKALETRIRDEFKPRPWKTLAEQIVGRVKTWDAAVLGGRSGPVAPPAEPGRYYWLRRTTETAVESGSHADEVYRVGEGWSSPDDWGCWTLSGGGDLDMKVIGAQAPYRMYLGLLGLPGRDARVQVVVGGEVEAELTLGHGENRWLPLSLTAAQAPGGRIQLRVQSQDGRDLAEVTDGVDTRHVSVGVIGFMVCATDDLVSRADFMEALNTNSLKNLHALHARRPLAPAAPTGADRKASAKVSGKTSRPAAKHPAVRKGAGE